MSYTNYDDVCSQLRDYGLLFEQPLRIGTPRSVRCRVEGGGKEKRGWYWLNEFQIEGNLVLVGSFGCFRGNESNKQKIKLGKLAKLDPAQAEALKRQIAEASKKADQERKRQIIHASRRASSMWSRLSVEGDSAYLLAKRVQGYGLRYTPKGTAVVPLLDTLGQVFGLQFLRTAAQAEMSKRPTKEYWPAGLAKQGHFHLIGKPPAGDEVVLVCEGYATGGTLHEATGLPVVVAFDANNIDPVCMALRKQWRTARLLVCADADSLGTCRDKECGARVTLADHPVDCPACGKPHRWTNAGESVARTTVVGQPAGLASWLAPMFADDDARRVAFLQRGTKLTDFNDLAAVESTLAVGEQVKAQLRAQGWLAVQKAAPAPPAPGGRGKALTIIHRVDDLLHRFAWVYGGKDAVFDRDEHKLVTAADVKGLCIRADVHKAWMEHPERQLVRLEAIGFDPTGMDRNVECNLWAGWPTLPQAGECGMLMDHLYYLCSEEKNAREVYEWVLNWLAFPLQNPGAKMRSTIVVHGGQGTGKNVIFEAVQDIYGEYGLVLDQNALADKHNDWASRKLFVIADEVVAGSDRFDIKNVLKGLITGKTLRINPKHMAARSESNHVNVVFLSNERMPVVLEEDDRRHCVIHTPRAKDEAYYIALAAEIDNGGVAALHDLLLSRDLAGFNEHSKPPYTESKERLISLARDNAAEFIDAVLDGDVGALKPLPVGGNPATPLAGLTQDWFEVYRTWCTRSGVKPTSLKQFVSIISERRRITTTRKGYRLGSGGITNPKSVITWGRRPDDRTAECDWLACQIEAMRNAMKDYQNLHSYGVSV